MAFNPGGVMREEAGWGVRLGRGALKALRVFCLAFLWTVYGLLWIMTLSSIATGRQRPQL